MTALMRTQRTSSTRLAWIAAAVGAGALGLASRTHGGGLPPFVAAYAGDTLWAIVVYAIGGAVAPSASIRMRAACSLASAFAVECSQLLQAGWLDALRGTTLGALVLGRGFLWSDLACYAAGIALAAAAEAAARGVAQRLARRAAPDSPSPPR